MNGVGNVDEILNKTQLFLVVPSVVDSQYTNPGNMRQRLRFQLIKQILLGLQSNN